MSDPLAYFLTWTTYGTWLSGDERGWVAKPGIFLEPDQALENRMRERMTEAPVVLEQEQRKLVERTISEHCDFRRWQLYAVNCRTPHVHVVVTAPDYLPKLVMDQFKG